MNPFLVGYIGMLGIFMTHAIARVAYACGKEQSTLITYESPRSHYRFPSDNPCENIEVEMSMERYVAERHIPMDMVMMISSEDMRNEMIDEVKRDLEYTIFDGLRAYITIKEFKEDGRRDLPFPCKTFRASIRVAKDEY